MWGARSLIGPGIMMLMMAMGMAAAIMLRGFLLRASTGARTLDATCQRAVSRWKLDDVSTLSSCMFLISLVTLLSAWWYFSALIEGLLVSDISTATAQQLSAFSPYNRGQYETFRATFTWVVVICFIVWYPPWRLAKRRGERLNRGIVLGGTAVALLAVLTLDFPYRIIYHARFPVAVWKGTRCYVLGERTEDVLLFCPPNDPPRSRSMDAQASDLAHQGVTENIFTQFSPTAMGQR
jgi:hypothetical protein